MTAFLNTIISNVIYFFQLIKTDWSFLVPIIIELLVIFIKILVGNMNDISERIKNQVIDAPTDFMAIILGYMGGVLILPQTDIQKHWGYTVAMIIGMMAVWFLNNLNRIKLQALHDMSKKEKIITGFKLTLFLGVMYIIPIVALVGTMTFCKDIVN